MFGFNKQNNNYRKRKVVNQKKYYSKNKEYYTEYNKEYYQKNKGELQRHKRIHYMNNREEINTKCKEYRESKNNIIICECGKKIKELSKYYHVKSNKHKQYLESHDNNKKEALVKLAEYFCVT